MLLARRGRNTLIIRGMNNGTTDSYLNSMGKRLRIHREDMGISQTELAQRMERYGVNVRSAHISGIERRGKAPSVPVLAAIARALNTSSDYLLMLSDDPSPYGESAPGTPLYISEQADEIARIVDNLPPYRRDELLVHARMVEIMEVQSERDVRGALDTVALKLRSAGLVIGEDALAQIRRVLLDYTADILGTNATASVDAVAISGELQSRRKAVR